MFSIRFRFENSDETVMYADAGETLLSVARKGNIAIDAPCSGNASCGKCRVRLLEGEVESAPSRHISKEDYEKGWRLSCDSRVMADAVVEVPDIASAYRSRMKTADLSTPAEMALFEQSRANLDEAGIAFGNGWFSVVVRMDAPTLDDTMPDIERLERAVCEAVGAEKLCLPYALMAELPGLLRENGFALRVCGLHKGDTARAMLLLPPDDATPVCGIAVDIGTTTVTALMVDLISDEVLSKASTGNGQIRYGADVINRIIESTREGGRKRLQDAILKETLYPLFALLCRDAHIPARSVLGVCIAGNTTMNHLLLGVDADPVRTEPYIPAFFSWNGLKAGDLKLPVNPLSPVVLAPNIGSYVGGDITAGTLMSMIWNRDELSLFIDLGTNGELVFGNRDFLMSCACSAGPAFEGGDISCGMRATDGAIETCRIDRESMEPSFNVIGNGKPVGLCGSGIIDTIAELFRCGIISAKGQFIREGRRISKDNNGFDCYVLAFPEESATERRVTLNTVDIDNFIRAKGAIFSAICTLLKSLDMDVSCIEHVYVAGGIGSGINMRNSVRIGMFPDLPDECFSYIGNSSLMGAYAMLISTQAREEVDELGHSMTYVELSTTPGYMDEFLAACFLPHTNAELFPSAMDME